MADGSIRVNTSLNLTGIKRDIKELEKELSKAQKEIDDLEKSKEKSTSEYEDDAENGFFNIKDEAIEKQIKIVEEIDKQIGEVEAKAEAYKQQLEGATAELERQQALSSANDMLGDAIKDDKFINSISSAEEYNSVLEKTKAQMAQIEQHAQEIANKTGVSKDELLGANQKYKELDNQLKLLIQHQGEFGNELKKSFSGADRLANRFSHSVKKGIKMMARYTLAIFGARSAFFAVKQMMNSYISDNEELANSVSSIKGAFAEMLGPAIERVINLVKIAMSYVFAFIKALTGVDYVARYNAKALSKQTGATKALTKAQKENQRQSAGFDEQTKLSDNTSSGGGGDVSGGGVSGLELPTISDEALGKIQVFADKLKEVWTWIRKNKEELIAMAGAVALAFTIAKIVDWISNIGEASKVLGELAGKLKLFAGLALIAIGAFMIVDAIKDMIENGPNWKNILELLAGAIMVLVGAILIFNASLLASPVTWIIIGIMALIAVIALCIVYWDEIKEAFIKAWEKIKEYFKETADNIKQNWEDFKATVTQLWDDMCEAIKKAWENVKKFFIDAWAKIKETFSNVGAWFKEKFTEASTKIKESWAGIKKFFSDTLKNIKDVFSNIVGWFKEKFTEAWNKIKGVFSGVGSFFGKIWETIKSKFTSIGTTIGNAIGGAFKKVVNSIINFAENTINGFIRAINKAITLINKIPSVNISPLKELSIPKLARGGIVNNVGRGVPLIAGEAGREAILPLENNTEWMDVLVDKINGGNTTIPIYLDGKQIAKYVIERQKKQAFALNGG